MTTRLSAGDRAPDFTLTDDRGERVSLGDLRGRKAIVYVYPAAMTPGCTTQACDFSDNLEALTGQGYAVVGVSPDSPEKLARFREKENLTITLLSDPDKDMLQAWGAFGEKKLYGKVVEGVIRSTVVLDEDGVVTHAWYNVKATGHVAKIMRDLGLDAAAQR
jgi:peroxiredoxin Q/BCP